MYSSYFHPMSAEQESRQQAPPSVQPAPAIFPPLPPLPLPGGGTNARIDQLQRQINSLNRRVNRIENMLGMRYYY